MMHNSKTFQLGGALGVLPGGAAASLPMPREVIAAAPNMLTSPEAIAAMTKAGGAVHDVTMCLGYAGASAGKSGDVTGTVADRAAAMTRAAIDPNRPPLGKPMLAIIPGGLA